MTRLLIIDDDREHAGLVETVAAGLGFAVEATQDPRRFLELAVHWLPAIVVIDLMIPEIDGIELIRALADGRSNATVVLVSGMDRRIVAAAQRLAEDRGLRVAGVLLKPYRVETLRKILAPLAAAG